MWRTTRFSGWCIHQIVVHQDAVGRAFHVLELPTFHGPQENQGNECHEYKAQGDKEIEDIHVVFLLVAAHGISCLEVSAIKKLYGATPILPLWEPIRDRRMAFSTTNREDRDMPMPAIQGVT